jgi:glycosyltransferase involved in cell wall biosynthesis
MAKLLFVVHRYAPYPGGSEANTHRLAHQAVIEGHDVLVLADTHMGDYEGVSVTNDRRVAYDKYDLIIVHGSCPTQDFVHAQKLQSPVYYILIEPPKNAIATGAGLTNATWIGCGTTQDWKFIRSTRHANKARAFIYSVPKEAEFSPDTEIRDLLGVDTPYMAMSAGGFWPHKRFHELVDAFNKADNPDWSLVLFGYDTSHPFPTHGNARVKVVGGADPDHIYAAMASADL